MSRLVNESNSQFGNAMLHKFEHSQPHRLHDTHIGT